MDDPFETMDPDEKAALGGYFTMPREVSQPPKSCHHIDRLTEAEKQEAQGIMAKFELEIKRRIKEYSKKARQKKPLFEDIKE